MHTRAHNTCIGLAAPPKKRPRKEKKVGESNGEEYGCVCEVPVQAEERFNKWEEERWKEVELEERQRLEDRQHQLQIMHVRANDTAKAIPTTTIQL